jgi:hypothetical protein
MPETIEQWKTQLGRLPRKDRAVLAHFLLVSLDPDEAIDEAAIA